MAIEYRLLFNIAALDDEICRVIGECVGAACEQDGNGLVCFELPGVSCTFFPAAELTRELTEEAYGFAPTKSFRFRLDKFDGFDIGLENTIRTVVCLVRELSGDCVFLEGDGNVPAFLRKESQLIFRKDDDPAAERMISKIADGIGEAYTFGSLPTF